MKRTGEITLSIIGSILSALGTLVGIFFLFIGGSEEVKNEMLSEVANDPTLVTEDVEIILSFFSGLGVAFVIAAILGVIIGIVGAVSVKGNKNPKLAGWVLIIGAILTGIISVGAAFLPALLFLIAGIMCFVRKPPVEPTDYQTI